MGVDVTVYADGMTVAGTIEGSDGVGLDFYEAVVLRGPLKTIRLTDGRLVSVPANALVTFEEGI